MWLYPRSKGFIAQTNLAKEYKENLFDNKLKIKVIPNALISFDTNNQNDNLRERKILYVGRFEWEKDPEILIRAFKDVVSLNPNWILEMAGDGPLLEKMKNLANQLKIDANIVFLGKVKNIEKLYARSSIFVLPSIIEGFPNSLIEAMSFGLPCVCFSDIPFEDIISPNKNGTVLFERNHSELSITLNNLINEPSQRESIGHNARRIINLCAPEKISKEILDFMNS
jgi:glycosyltransferase involved in cell wall biosynthesis